jgi:hypothetical protein
VQQKYNEVCFCCHKALGCRIFSWAADGNAGGVGMQGPVL